MSFQSSIGLGTSNAGAEGFTWELVKAGLNVVGAVADAVGKVVVVVGSRAVPATARAMAKVAAKVAVPATVRAAVRASHAGPGSPCSPATVPTTAR